MAMNGVSSCLLCHSRMATWLPSMKISFSVYYVTESMINVFAFSSSLLDMQISFLFRPLPLSRKSKLWIRLSLSLEFYYLLVNI